MSRPLNAPLTSVALRSQINKAPLEVKDRLLLNALALIAATLEKIANK